MSYKLVFIEGNQFYAYFVDEYNVDEEYVTFTDSKTGHKVKYAKQYLVKIMESSQ